LNFPNPECVLCYTAIGAKRDVIIRYNGVCKACEDIGLARIRRRLLSMR